MVNGKGLAIAAIIGLVLWAWSKRKVVAAPVAPLLTSTKAPTTTEEAKQMTSQVASELNAVGAQYPDDPTLANHISQAIQSALATLSQGSSLAEDRGAQIFNEQLKAYEQYKAAGGKNSFEVFSVFSDWRNWQSFPEFQVPVPIPTPTPTPITPTPKRHVWKRHVWRGVVPKPLRAGYTTAESRYLKPTHYEE